MQVFASGFLQIPPHDGHPCLWLIIPTVKAYSGLSPPSCRPCRAHSKYKKRGDNPRFLYDLNDFINKVVDNFRYNKGYHQS
ncbi:hypothetical protein B8A44_06140 [Dolosigranulum pigrum]|uniref:Uncharacterized protein n=1 Tax=Dolosigranulum pigrum TaxID=29394 RepID=A0A328KQL3_9LACT|nr:hypothetical protein B8A44_06140 [Dolosigranulum pigrum]